MRIILMGPPGAGKGTQAVGIASRLGVPHISTGDLFRAAIKAGTPLGEEAASFINRGEYVPDAVTNGMVRERLSEPDAATGFLLDGYPRTVEQIWALDEMLSSKDLSVDRVVEITVDNEQLIARLTKRALEQGRLDDTESVIRHRMDVYHQLTEPLTVMYAARNQLVKVNGMGTVEEVAERIMQALGR